MRYPDADYSHRIEQARAAMASHGVDALLLSIGTDLPYLTGYEAMPSERMTMGVITPSEAAIVVPQLEAPRVEQRSGLEVLPWGETEDPIALVAKLAGAPGRVAVGAQTWSGFLISLQQAMPGSEYLDATAVMRNLRIVKDESEIDLLRRAAAAVDAVVARLRVMSFAGRSEAEVAGDIAAMTVEEGHDVASFGIVASGPNAASPHHEPGGRVIGEGDSIVIDFGGRLRGYCSDTTRTFHVGAPAPDFVSAYTTLQAAQAAGRAAAGPGVPAQSVDRAARRVIDEAGWGEWFIHRLGHGIGLDVHEDPYLVEGNEESLQPGMAFSVEPGIYMPQQWGMRIEDIVVCTDDGAESLNNSPRSLAVVE